MAKTIIRRLITSFLTIFFSTVVVFAFRFLLPGGPAESMAVGSAGSGTITQAQIDAIVRRFGLDQSIWTQYVDWIKALAHGHLGTSFFSGESVTTLIAQHAGPSLELIIAALVVSTVVGTLLGVFAAVNRDKWFGRAFLTATGLGVSVPDFWLAAILAAVIGLQLQLLPAIGFHTFGEGLNANVRSMILPVLSLSLVASSFIGRHLYNAMAQVLERPYVRTAWAMGLPARTVYLRCALRNSIGPVVTFLPLAFASLIGGTVVVEYVFNIPGLGTEIVTAVKQQDYPVIQGVVLLAGVLVAALNLLADLAVSVIDPRAR